jgi:hypothetical protein
MREARTALGIWLKLRKRFLTLFTAADHLLLALFTLGNCVRGETISAVAWSLEQDGRLLGFTRPIIDFLLEDDHCRKQWEFEAYLRAPR